MSEPRPAAAASPRRVAAMLALALLALTTLGLRDGSLGVAWPSMRASFHQPLASLGLLLLLANAGYLLSSSTSGATTARLGAGPLLAAASAAAAVALAVYCVATRWPLLLAAAALLGLANGVIDTGVNAHVALHHGVRAMGMVHAAYGVGATGGPLLVAVLLDAGAGWRPAFAVLLALEAILAARLWATRRGWSAPGPSAGPEVRPRRPLRPRRGQGSPSTRSLLGLGLAVFFVYAGVEVATGAWAYSLLTIGRRVGRGAAGTWVASYWGALTAGRLLLGFVGHRMTADRLLRWSGAVTAAGAALLWWNPSPWIGEAGLPVLGVGLAAIFPTLVSVTPDRHGALRAHAVIGYQFAAASVGGAALAALAGVIAGHLGPAALGPYLAAGTGVLLLLVEITGVAARRSA